MNRHKRDFHFFGTKCVPCLWFAKEPQYTVHMARHGTKTGVGLGNLKSNEDNINEIGVGLGNLKINDDSGYEENGKNKYGAENYGQEKHRPKIQM